MGAHKDRKRGRTVRKGTENPEMEGGAVTCVGGHRRVSVAPATSYQLPATGFSPIHFTHH